MAFTKEHYPKEWKLIRAHILERASMQCECTGECGLHDGEDLFTERKRCEEYHLKPAKWAHGKVVLTLAHLCHNSRCSNVRHIKAMCNRCHLRYDVDFHTLNKHSRNKHALAQVTKQRRLVREIYGKCIVDA